MNKYVKIQKKKKEIKFFFSKKFLRINLIHTLKCFHYYLNSKVITNAS